jgi:hypothetical protein
MPAISSASCSSCRGNPIGEWAPVGRWFGSGICDVGAQPAFGYRFGVGLTRRPRSFVRGREHEATRRLVRQRRRPAHLLLQRQVVDRAGQRRSPIQRRRRTLASIDPGPPALRSPRHPLSSAPTRCSGGAPAPRSRGQEDLERGLRKHTVPCQPSTTTPCDAPHRLALRAFTTPAQRDRGHFRHARRHALGRISTSTSRQPLGPWALIARTAAR